MITKAELARVRPAVFDGGDCLCFDNAEARHAIQIFEMVDRMVDADLIMGEGGDLESERLADAENSFDAALAELLTLVKTARESHTAAEDATGGMRTAPAGAPEDKL